MSASLVIEGAVVTKNQSVLLRGMFYLDFVIDVLMRLISALSFECADLIDYCHWVIYLRTPCVKQIKVTSSSVTAKEGNLMWIQVVVQPRQLRLRLGRTLNKLNSNRSKFFCRITVTMLYVNVLNFGFRH